MAVTIADTFAPKNNLDFPVVESKDVKGGIHCVESTEERDALLTSQKAEAGMLVYVKGADGSQGKTYQMNDTKTAFVPFGGELTSDQLSEILTYVETNMESSKYTEDDEGNGILELL